MAIKIVSSLNNSAQMANQLSSKASESAMKSVASSVTSTLAAVVSVSNVGRAANGKGVVPTDFKEATRLADNIAERIKGNKDEAKASYGNIGSDNAMSIYR